MPSPRGVSIRFALRPDTSRAVDRAVRKDEVRDEVLAIRAEAIPRSIAMARRIHRLDASAHFIHEGCVCIGEWGEKHGFSARGTRLLAAVGRALEVRPDLEQHLLDGAMSLEAAAVLGKVHADPDLVEDGTVEWVAPADPPPGADPPPDQPSGSEPPAPDPESPGGGPDPPG